MRIKTETELYQPLEMAIRVSLQNKTTIYDRNDNDIYGMKQMKAQIRSFPKKMYLWSQHWP